MVRSRIRFEDNINNKERVGILFSSVDNLELADHTKDIIKNRKFNYAKHITINKP